MREHIQLIFNENESGHAEGAHRQWDCFLEGQQVGYISYAPNRQWKKGDFRAYVFNCENPRIYGYENRRSTYQGEYNCLYAAKLGMLEKAKQFLYYLGNEKVRKAPAAYLPSADFQFYPTPSDLAGKLFEVVNFNKVKTVLEPSAGKGDLLEYATQRKRTYRVGRGRSARYYSDREGLDCDCIEIDLNLQAILKSKGFRVVHDDFLSFMTRKRYDLILMNPPFSEGDLHLLRAIEMAGNGGQIACILNAETIRNPCTNSRRLLAKKLNDVGASVRFINDAFARSERRAKVDVALINISIPYTFADETIWENLKRAREVGGVDHEEQTNGLAPKDNIERLILEHDLMCEAGISLMRCYNGIAPRLSTQPDHAHPMITLNVGSDNDQRIGKCEVEHVNSFLRMVRARYWQHLFDLPDLRSKMTSDMQEQYRSLINEMREYEFSKFNIQQVIERIMGQIAVGVEEAIVKCFEKLSAEHSYHSDVQNENIHYYNGWKTNKAHYVNNKCIIPTWGCFATAYRENSRGRYQDYYTEISPIGCFNVLSDLEKALNYLDKGETSDIDMMQALEAAKIANKNRNIECKYFTVTFFKKGTCHIKFREQKIVDRLNIYVGRNKAWLPPSYGKVRYDEMDEESRRVVDEFQGREAYEQVMKNADEYLVDVKEIPMLTA